MSTPESVVIAETARLRLRRFVDADAEFYQALVSDPGYVRFIADRGVDSIDAALAELGERIYRSYEKNGFGMYLVERLSDNKPVGGAGLIRRDFLEHVDLGYAFLPQGRSQGLVTEAGLAVLQHARQDLGLATVAAITSLDNAASISVLGRLGFTDKGVRPWPDSDETVAYFECQLMPNPRLVDAVERS